MRWLEVAALWLLVGAFSASAVARDVAVLGDNADATLSQTSDQDALEDLAAVPDDIECYHELVEKVKEIDTRLTNQKDKMHIESVKFNQTSEVKEGALHKVQKLEEEVVKLRAAMDESKRAYKKDHVAALSTYELARSALNKYNDLSKKGEDETSRSQQDMAAYLKYKELGLKATDQADDENAARYQHMSDKYLESYTSLEKSIKQHLTDAKSANEQYQELSTKYDEAGKEVKALEVASEQNTKQYEDTNTELEHQKAVYDQAVKDSSEAQEKYEEIRNQVKLSTQELEDGRTEQIVANRDFHQADKKLKQLTDKLSGATSKLSRYREITFQFETKAREYGEQAVEQERLEEAYAAKREAAERATQAFSDAYETAGCGVLPHRKAAKKAKQDELQKARQAAGMAVQLADDELQSADRIRKAATVEASRSSANVMLGEAGVPDWKVRFEQFVDRFMSQNQNSVEATTSEMKAQHHADATATQRAVVVLLQEATDQKEDRCEHTKQVATINLHAKEDAGMMKDQHGDSGRKLRKQQQSNLSGVTSTTVIVKNMKIRISNLKAEIEAVKEKRQTPCVVTKTKR